MHRRDLLKTATSTLTHPALAWYGQNGSSPYRPLDHVSIPNAKEAVVGSAGDTAFVAATTRFVTVDISTPGDLSIQAEKWNLLADHENGPLRTIWDVRVEDDRLIVAGPANPTSGVHGFLIYNVSDPAPGPIAVHETEFPIHNCFLRNGLVYLTGNNRKGNPLVIVDVRDDSPEEIGRWSLVDHDERWIDVHWQLR